MSVHRRLHLALTAHSTAKKQFKAIVAAIEGAGPAISVQVIHANSVSAKLEILGWPYLLECRLCKGGSSGYETKLTLFRTERDGDYTECYSVVFDPLGNFALGEDKSSRIHNISIASDIEWVCREFVFVEADRLDSAG